MAPPTVERRFDIDAAASTWSPESLAERLGGYFADRDPDRTFACTDVLALS
jgi:3-oxoacyl-[acyl-carrier protein] reductase